MSTSQLQNRNAEQELEGHPERGQLLRRVLMRQEVTLILVMVAIIVATGIKNPVFLEQENLLEILRASVIYFVMACGAALLIIGGGLDFSLGAVFTFASLVCTQQLVDGRNVGLAVLLGLGAAALIGAVNHFVITLLHVPPIIATLGVFFILSGINAQLTGGNDVLPLPDNFQSLGQGSILGISSVIWYAVIAGIVFWFILEQTRFGINVRALGGNREAAVSNGLRTARLDLALYVITALATGLAGIIYSARVGAGQVEAGGTGITLSVLTAVLIGGVSLFGGLGSITGVACGAILLSVIDNALILSEIPPQYNNIVIGTILIGAVAIDHVRRQQLYRKR